MARAYLHQTVDRAAGLPKRRRNIRHWLIPLAVLVVTVVALPQLNQNRASAADVSGYPLAAGETEAVASSSSIADEALKDLNTWQGQCFTWVKKVVDRATPYTMGFGYRDGYLNAGAVEVPLSEAVRGDIIQLANNALGNSFYLGLHTAIVLKPLGGGRFDVIDSNQNWDEIVRLRLGYDPRASAARYPGISVHVYRFPGGSTTAAPPPPATELAAGVPAIVSTGGDCLRIRSAPGLSGTRLDCLPDGTAVSVTGPATTVDGLEWVPVDSYFGSGWMASIYLSMAQPNTEEVPEPVTTPPVDEPPVPADTSTDAGDTTTIANVAEAGYTLAIPPLGGVTRGPAGTDNPVALVQAQAFPVQTLSMFDIQAQRYLTFVPGAPPYVNTLSTTTLDPDAIVAVKRADVGAADAVIPDAIPIQGAIAFPEPPANGLTQGIAGTTDVSTLIAVQSFEVAALAAWDLSTQRFLTFIAGAPSFANTLSDTTLRPEMAVMVRRSSGSTAPAGPPPATDSPTAGQPPADAPPATPPAADQRLASITYYYCSQGSNPAGLGDGGGWCGGMANGQVVYEGAAACASQYLGQQFTIVGDPTGRTYTCTDTGGGVTGEHRDIFFNNSDSGYSWWLQVGATATIEIVTP